VTNTVTDLAGKGWGELVALGIPMECTVKYKDITEANGMKDVKLYMKGKMFKETVTMTQDGKDIAMSVISKDDGYVYIKYESSNMMSTLTQGKIQCDGMKYPTTSTGSTTTGSTTTDSSVPVDTSSLEDTNKVNIDCKPAVFGDEMFSTAGKYCTMKEITTAIMGDQNPCAQITDPATKAQCEAVYS